MSLVLGLDIGSTFVKAVVFDRRGRALASAAEAVPSLRPGLDGLNEMPTARGKKPRRLSAEWSGIALRQSRPWA